VGKPEDEAYRLSLVNLCKELGVTEQVVFHGFVPNDEMATLVQSSLAGLALFPGGKANYSNFGVIGKIREYLENGLPVILSKASAMAADLEAAGAALPVGDSASEVAYATELLLDDPGRRKKMQEAAYAFACKKSDPSPYYKAIESAIASQA
jgi:glycosyltransferase involved in cell wall biosynthesis